MANKVRSSRGVMVDFDQIKIKQQLAQAPSTTDVKAREDFVERRSRRRASRKLLADQKTAEAAAIQAAIPQEVEVDTKHVVEPSTNTDTTISEDNSVSTTTRKQQRKSN